MTTAVHAGFHVTYGHFPSAIKPAHVVYLFEELRVHMLKIKISFKFNVFVFYFTS